METKHKHQRNKKRTEFGKASTCISLNNEEFPELKLVGSLEFDEPDLVSADPEWFLPDGSLSRRSLLKDSAPGTASVKPSIRARNEAEKASLNP